MSKNTNIQSVEPNIADLVNGWLKSYKLDYKLEQESLNTEIDQALDDYYSKSGGKGGNRPDAKLLLHANDGKYYPVLIEYKGYKDKLVKLDAEGNIANKTAIIERIIGKNESTDWNALDANSIPEICPIVCSSNTPENTIANEVNKQRTPVKNVSSNATKPCDMCSFA